MGEELKKNPSVTEWSDIPEKNGLKVGFLGAEADRVELLRSLIAAGISVLEFTCAQEDLEEIFLKYRL